MIISSAYTLGIEAAEKEAGLKDIIKNLALAGTIGGSSLGGAHIGAKRGEEFFANRAAPQLAALMEKAPVVNSAEFIASHGQGAKYYAPNKGGVKSYLSDLREKGILAAEVDLEEAADAMVKTKDLMDAVSGPSNPHANSYTGGILAQEMENPSALSHEIGHIHHARKTDPKILDSHNSMLGTIFGQKYNDEKEAWNTARSMKLPIDPRLEEGALNTYDMGRKGAISGGMVGGGAGAGGSAGLLLAIQALLERLRGKKR